MNANLPQKTRANLWMLVEYLLQLGAESWADGDMPRAQHCAHHAWRIVEEDLQ